MLEAHYKKGGLTCCGISSTQSILSCDLFCLLYITSLSPRISFALSIHLLHSLPILLVLTPVNSLFTILFIHFFNVPIPPHYALNYYFFTNDKVYFSFFILSALIPIISLRFSIFTFLILDLSLSLSLFIPYFHFYKSEL